MDAVLRVEILVVLTHHVSARYRAALLKVAAKFMGCFNFLLKSITEPCKNHLEKNVKLESKFCFLY